MDYVGQVAHLKERFRSHLGQIGLEVSPEEADSLLLPIQDDIVSMAASIKNVGLLNAQLERLVDKSRELPSHTRRYYGMYVLLVYAIYSVQRHFIEEIDATYIPKLFSFEQGASRNIADARDQLSRGGPREPLLANIEAGKTTVEACKFLTDALHKQKGAVAAENAYTGRMFEAAANTYRTVRLSLNVAELTSDCQAAFRALRELKVPRLRPFQNMPLKEELQRLAERMRE